MAKNACDCISCLIERTAKEDPVNLVRAFTAVVLQMTPARYRQIIDNDPAEVVAEVIPHIRNLRPHMIRVAKKFEFKLDKELLVEDEPEGHTVPTTVLDDMFSRKKRKET